MGRGRGLLSRSAVLLFGGVLSVGVAAGQSLPAGEGAGRELSAEVLAALERIEDFVFNFDQPGFYAVVAAVRQSPQSPGFAEVPLAVADWREFLERPGEYRGRVVTVAGVVGRRKDPYSLPLHPELGWLWQVELRRDDQPVTCTLILTESAGDVPVGAMLDVTGYFVMARQYHGANGRVQQAALIVAPGPTVLSQVVPPRAESVLDWRWMLAAVVGGLLVTIWLLRWARHSGQRDVRTLTAAHGSPVNLADDLAAWADEQRDDH